LLIRKRNPPYSPFNRKDILNSALNPDGLAHPLTQVALTLSKFDY